jgi:hypothetical protein
MPSAIIGDYFDNRQYGANKTFLLIKRQFICAPNHFGARKEMQSEPEKIREFKTVSKFTLQIPSASPLTQ